MPKKSKAQKEIWHGEEDEDESKLVKDISKLSTNDDAEGDGRKPKKKGVSYDTKQKTNRQKYI